MSDPKQTDRADQDGDPYTTAIKSGPSVTTRLAADPPKRSPKDALDEMVNDPVGVRMRIIEELQAEGMPENRVREEMALIEATLGI